MNSLMLFGVRSPLVTDYEETCARLGFQIAAAVRADELRPRILDRNLVVDLSELDDTNRRLGFVACAFNPYRRSELVELAVGSGLKAASALIDPGAIVASSTRIGAGSFINAGVVIASAGFVGEHVLINRSSSVGHHGVLEDFVSVGPGVTVAGNVRIGRYGFVGAGAIVLQGVRIGAGAIVAAGSVVKEAVEDGVLVAGNPAKVVRRDPDISLLGADGEE